MNSPSRDVAFDGMRSGRPLNWMQGIEHQEPGKEKLNWLSRLLVISTLGHVGSGAPEGLEPGGQTVAFGAPRG